MKKFISIEYLKAFSMLYIVGYWHLLGYSKAFPQWENVVTERLTLIVLGLFVFLSGFLLGDKIAKMSVAEFFKKRFTRIFPLYALAVICFFLFRLNDGTTSLKSMLGIAMFYGPSPLTLWFITMIVVFYALTPLLSRYVVAIKKYISLCTSLFLIAFAAQCYFGTLDSRLFLYFPCFCLGIACVNYPSVIKRSSQLFAGIALIVGILVSFAIEPKWSALNGIKNIPMVVSAAFLIFSISFKNEQRFRESKFISLLSYASFAMYLFHRPIIMSAIAAYFPKNALAQSAYLVFVCLPIVAFISWILQKLYDASYSRAFVMIQQNY